MDKLTITIDLGNSAFFTGDPSSEISRCLQQVVRGIDTVPCGPNGIRRPILDTNGNTVGHWEVDG